MRIISLRQFVGVPIANFITVKWENILELSILHDLFWHCDIGFWGRWQRCLFKTILLRYSFCFDRDIIKKKKKKMLNYQNFHWCSEKDQCTETKCLCLISDSRYRSVLPCHERNSRVGTIHLWHVPSISCKMWYVQEAMYTGISSKITFFFL